MRICLDIRTAGERMHGIARYGTELARAILRRGGPEELYLLVRAPLEVDGSLTGRAVIVPTRAAPYSVHEQAMVPLLVARLRPDVYHCATYACPVLVPVPCLFTIHDLLPLERPGEFGTSVRLYHRVIVRLAARRARRILSVSQHTQRAIRRELGVPAARIRVIHPGGDHLGHQHVSRADREAFQRLAPAGSAFFLCVANPRPHKNTRFAVDSLLASDRLRERDVRLILTGEPDRSLRSFVEARRAAGRVLFAGAVSDGLLRLLYDAALGLLVPSRGEGFCLPAAEAMQAGLPVVAARDGALPEVLGQAGILLPPEDLRTWRLSLECVFEARVGGAWNGRGVRERGTRFTWERTAAETLRAYREALSSESVG